MRNEWGKEGNRPQVCWFAAGVVVALCVFASIVGLARTLSVGARKAGIGPSLLTNGAITRGKREKGGRGPLGMRSVARGEWRRWGGNRRLTQERAACMHRRAGGDVSIDTPWTVLDWRSSARWRDERTERRY
jgi:hypothetical protein